MEAVPCSPRHSKYITCLLNVWRTGTDGYAASPFYAPITVDFAIFVKSRHAIDVLKKWFFGGGGFLCKGISMHEDCNETSSKNASELIDR
jgi:hypothetical protein